MAVKHQGDYRFSDDDEEEEERTDYSGAPILVGGSRSGEKILAGELCFALLLITIAKMREQKAMPTPSQYVGVTVAYSMLAALALAGPKPAKLASGFGGLILLALLVGNAGKFATAVGGAVESATGTPNYAITPVSASSADYSVSSAVSSSTSSPQGTTGQSNVSGTISV
jgi:hypothetical protein